MIKPFNKSIIHFILIILISLFFLFPTLIIADGINPIIGEDDIYEKNISVSNSVSFNWTLYKNSDRDYIVTVKAEGFETWSQTISPSFFILDDLSPYKIVGLKANIPQYPDNLKKTAIITFTFRPLNGTEKIIINKTATITIDSIIFQKEENKILGIFDNPLPEPLNTPVGAFILNVIIWIFIAFALYYFIKVILIGLARKTKTDFDDRLIQIVRTPFLIIIILYGAVQSVFKLQFTVGLQIYILQISIFLFFIIGIYIIYRVYNESLEAWGQRKGEESMFNAVTKPILKKIGISIILVGGFIVALNASGIQVTALLAGAGIMGIVIAFAAQDTLSNFFSGIHLLLDQPFKIGDVIYMETGNYWRVVNVGLRSTRLYSIFDNELVIMPNNSVANQKIINVVKPDAKIRKKINVSVAYGTDLKKVIKILLEIAQKNPHVLKEKEFEPLIRVTDFGDSGIEFTMNLWIDEVMNQWFVLSDIRLEIDNQFKKEKIIIPFPQRTLWINQKDKTDIVNNKLNSKKDKEEKKKK